MCIGLFLYTFVLVLFDLFYLFIFISPFLGACCSCFKLSQQENQGFPALPVCPKHCPEQPFSFPTQKTVPAAPGQAKPGFVQTPLAVLGCIIRCGDGTTPFSTSVAVLGLLPLPTPFPFGLGCHP